METRVAEVADGIHQLATFIPERTRDQPVPDHGGRAAALPHRHARPVPARVRRRLTVLPAASLRWVGFGHVEADESGSMNEWLSLAPAATVVQGQIGCMVSIGDLADRPPRPLADGEKLDIGGHVLQWFDTPHVPHAWEAGVLYDATTRTLSAATCSRGWASTRRARVTTSSGRPSAPRTSLPVRCRCTRRARRPSDGSRSSTSTRWRSCTARRSRATAARRSSRWLPTSTAASLSSAERAPLASIS